MGNIQPFARATEREDGSYIGSQLGIVSYGSDDTYQVSYFELGARGDHLYDALGPKDKSRKVTDVATYDDDLMRPDPVKEAILADRIKNAVPVDTAETDNDTAVNS